MLSLIKPNLFKKETWKLLIYTFIFSRAGRPPPLSYIIPTFTVTINPLEANEVTLPLSPSKKIDNSKSKFIKADSIDGPSLNNNKIRNIRGRKDSSSHSPRSIANTTIIVDDDGNEVIKDDNQDKSNDRMLSIEDEDDELRR